MVDTLKIDLSTVESFTDPTTGSGEISLFQEAFGQEGRPYIFMVEDPPHKTRPRHYHHGDVVYVYTKGEHHIEGEGTYRAGDVRWTRAGHAYGPETTGSEGGAWWVISYNDPIPIDLHPDAEAPNTEKLQQAAAVGELPHFTRPYDWGAIDHAVQKLGGAIVEGLLDESELAKLDNDIDEYIANGAVSGDASSGNDSYDVFLGNKTIRLHGLAEKTPAAAELIAREELVSWAERAIKPLASSILLNAGELIQIQADEPAQILHRDTDSWPELPIAEAPALVNAIVALDNFTLQNGATYIAAGSWEWEKSRSPKKHELARAVMNRGDAALFRGDLVHGGGENDSEARRRAVSISYCAGWLRPVENSLLNLSKETIAGLSPKMQELIGFAPHDATSKRGGMVGLYENGDPRKALDKGPIV